MSLRVLHLITDLNTGGAEISLYRLLAAMDRAHFENQVVSLIPIGPVGEKIRSLGIPVHSLNMQPGRPTINGLFHLISLLRRERPNILQTWMYHADLVGGLAAYQAGSPPVVWGIHNTIGGQNKLKPLTYWTVRLNALLSNWLPDRIVFCAESSRKSHIRFGYAADKTTVIYNGFDVASFHPNPVARAEIRSMLGLEHDTPLIGLCARFHPDKDHETFFRAAAMLFHAMPNVHFVLWGESIDESNPVLSSLILPTRLARNTHLLGLRNDTAQLMAALDVATLSSCSEAFPSVIAEAMACGVPCVVTDVGDAAFLVGETGIIVPPKDPSSLAEGLRRMIAKGPDGRSWLGKAARHRIEANFGLERSVLEYQNLYQDLAEPNRSR